MTAQWYQYADGHWQLKLGEKVIATIDGPDNIKQDYSWTIKGVIFKSRQSGATLGYAKKSIEHYIQNFTC